MSPKICMMSASSSGEAVNNAKNVDLSVDDVVDLKGTAVLGEPIVGV